MNKNIGLTSRGDEEERIRLTADLLHAEEHTIETLKKEPYRAEELTKSIDNLRRTRQGSVRLWSGEKINPNHWCRTKHLVEASRRGEEIIENATRINPVEVSEIIKIINRVDKEKDIAIKNFRQGKTRITDEECFRCEEDLGKENYEKLKGLLSETKSLNRSISNKNNNPNNLNNSTIKGGVQMVDWTRLGVINGGQFAGKGITVLADYVDKEYPPADGAILKRKGLWINVGLGILGQVGALYFIKNENLKVAALVASSHTLTKVVDYAMEAATPATAARARLGVQRAPLRVTQRVAPTAPLGLITVD